MKNLQRHRRCLKRGAALLDVIAASVLVGILIVPSVKISAQVQESCRRLEMRNELALRCASVLEEEIAYLQQSFKSRSRQQLIRYEGRDLRCVIQSSDAAVDGGLPSRIICVSVLLWHDENHNGSLDSSEQSMFLLTRVVAPTIAAHVALLFPEWDFRFACYNDVRAGRC